MKDFHLCSKGFARTGFTKDQTIGIAALFAVDADNIACDRSDATVKRTRAGMTELFGLERDKRCKNGGCHHAFYGNFVDSKRQ